MSRAGRWQAVGPGAAVGPCEVLARRTALRVRWCGFVGGAGSPVIRGPARCRWLVVLWDSVSRGRGNSDSVSQEAGESGERTSRTPRAPARTPRTRGLLPATRVVPTTRAGPIGGYDCRRRPETGSNPSLTTTVNDGANGPTRTSWWAKHTTVIARSGPAHHRAGASCGGIDERLAKAQRG